MVERHTGHLRSIEEEDRVSIVTSLGKEFDGECIRHNEGKKEMWQFDVGDKKLAAHIAEEPSEHTPLWDSEDEKHRGYIESIDISGKTERPITHEELEEKADIVVDYVAGAHDDTEFFRPHTSAGYPDFELMLDIMGLEVGAIYESRSEMLGDTRGIVTERTDETIHHVEEYTVERGGFKNIRLHAREGDISWDKMMEGKINPRMKDGPSPVKLWQAWMLGDFEVIGHIGKVAGGWPDRS